MTWLAAVPASVVAVLGKGQLWARWQTENERRHESSEEKKAEWVVTKKRKEKAEEWRKLVPTVVREGVEAGCRGEE